MQRYQYKILYVWELEYLHTKLKNYLFNAVSTTIMRELTFSFKWKAKNRITSTTTITIDKNYNNIITTAKRDRIKIITI